MRRELLLEFLFEESEQDQGEETSREMRRNPVIPTQVNRPSLEFTLHDAEAFLYLPTPVVDSNNGRSIIFNVCAHTIEAVQGFFLLFQGHVDAIDRILGNLTLAGTVGFRNESLVIIGIDLL